MTFRHAVRSEWTKIRTLRPGVLAALTAALLMVLGALDARFPVPGCHAWAAGGCALPDVSGSGLRGGMLAQLALGVLGVLVVTSEYATGAIRTSLATVPRRGRLLAAKAAVCALVAFTVGGTASLAALYIDRRITAAPLQPGGHLDLLHVATGTGVHMALIGTAGVAAGFLTRSTAGGFAVLLAAVFMVPLSYPLLPALAEEPARTYWPFSAGAQVMTLMGEPRALPAWAGLGLLAATVTVALLIALVVFQRRES
ncbi:hypothetical protein ACFY4C_04130 [Actinomadura viridis]|uniref:hypothetical protein n=1 Tax=Actinomadura viridis TaxID=58110 RepID=UPI003686BA90